MEGGTLIWKSQVVVNNSPDIEYYGKPLPPPPHGMIWERNPEGNWYLVQLESPVPTPTGQVIAEEPGVIEHVVMPSDTLQGICLRYRVSAVDVRRMNMFSGNNIQFKKTLKIPVAAGTPVVYQPNSPELALQIFRNATNEGPIEAKIYMEENGNDVQKAITAWRADNVWDETNKYLKAVQESVRNEAVEVAPNVVIEDNKVSNREIELLTISRDFEVESSQPLLG